MFKNIDRVDKESADIFAKNYIFFSSIALLIIFSLYYNRLENYLFFPSFARKLSDEEK